MTLPATSPEPAAEAENDTCAVCGGTDERHDPACMMPLLEQALCDLAEDDPDCFDLNDGEDWGWEP